MLDSIVDTDPHVLENIQKTVTTNGFASVTSQYLLFDEKVC